MGLRTLVRRLYALSVDDPKAWDSSLWNLRGQTAAGENVNESNALTYSAVWAAVNLLSGTISALPLNLISRKSGRTVVQDGLPAHRVLHTAANEYMTAMSFREAQMAHLLLWGNAYAEIVRNGYGEVMALWPITPDRVKPFWDAGSLAYEIRVPNQATPVVLPRELMLHVPGLGFDGLVGYSVVAMARKSIGLGLAMETFGSDYFAQGLHPSAVITHTGRLSDDGRKLLREGMSETYGGLSKAHRLMLLQETSKFEKISIQPEESQFLECVVPATLLTMADGTSRAAKDIAVGDQVIGWAAGKAVASKVIAVGKPPRKTLVKIRTARGRELIASEDHPCLALPALRTPGGRVPKGNPEKWTAIKDLRVGSYVRVALGHPYTEPTMDYESGYFLGAMAGDGYARKGSCAFSQTDPGVIAFMSLVVRGLGGKLLRKGDTPDHNIVTNGKGCKGSAIRSLLNASGMVGKHSATKTVPASVLLGGRPAWMGFLSGYFDTDGSIRKPGGKQSPAAYWSSVSLQMLQGCQHLLAMLGIQSAIYPMQPGGRKQVMGQVCQALPGWGLYVMGVAPLSLLAQTIRARHTEKAKRLRAFDTAEPSRYRDVNVLYDRVVAIEELGEGETVGIEVDGCHTHVTAGLVTHNSRQFQIPEIARWFGLPPHKLGDLTRASFSNIAEEQISFVVDSLTPKLVRLEQCYNAQLLNANEQRRLYYKHALQGLMRGSHKDRAEYYAKLWNIGVLSANQILELEDMDPIEGGDTHFVPANMVPLERAIDPRYWTAAQPQQLPPGTKDQPDDSPGDPDSAEDQIAALLAPGNGRTHLEVPHAS